MKKKLGIHVLGVKQINRMYPHQANIKGNGKITEFDDTLVVVSIECSDTRQSVVEPARRNYMSESLE